LVWLNVAAFILTLVINSLAGSTTLIGGRNTAQVSNLYPSLITPPGYVFAIWGIIYLLLTLYIVFQALPAQRKAAFQEEIGYLFTLSCALNIAWLFLWQNDLIPLSLPLIVLLLISLAAIYWRLNEDTGKKSLKERLFVNLGFSAYFAWICIATMANAAALLVYLGFAGSGSGAVVMTILAALVVLGVTLFLIVRKRDLGFALVAAWAVSGIALKGGQDTTVLIAGLAVCLVIVAGVCLTLLKRGTK
jgi:tryptophan-rich sensory protein